MTQQQRRPSGYLTRLARLTNRLIAVSAAFATELRWWEGKEQNAPSQSKRGQVERQQQKSESRRATKPGNRGERARSHFKTDPGARRLTPSVDVDGTSRSTSHSHEKKATMYGGVTVAILTSKAPPPPRGQEATRAAASTPAGTQPHLHRRRRTSSHASRTTRRHTDRTR